MHSASPSSVSRAAPPTRNLFVGIFLFLLAAVCAVAPLPILYRSLGILLASYAAFAFAGMPFAYATALLTPAIGLVSGTTAWLVMLPVMLSSSLLAMLGLEYAWRYPALIVSPALYVIPQLIVWQLSQRRLFAVELPWDPTPEVWLSVHVLAALAGVLGALYVERRASRRDPQGAQG